MTEEFVTKSILKWLIDEKWNIICFDFPQSGTGRYLQPNDTSEKNKGSINPDIVAIKNGNCLFFENKDRYYHQDFLKVNELIVMNNYTEAINKLVGQYEVAMFYYGIGLPTIKFNQKAEESCGLVDFVIGIEDDGEVKTLYFDPMKKSPF